MGHGRRSFLGRLGELLSREYYVGGKEAHRKYAFLAACLISLPILFVLVDLVVHEFASRPRSTVMCCLGLLPFLMGILGIGACTTGVPWRGALQWGMTVGIAVLGSVASLGWWILGAFGWPSGDVVDASIWANKWNLAKMASWTVANVGMLFALLKARSTRQITG